MVAQKCFSATSVTICAYGSPVNVTQFVRVGPWIKLRQCTVLFKKAVVQQRTALNLSNHLTLRKLFPKFDVIGRTNSLYSTYLDFTLDSRRRVYGRLPYW